MSTGAAEGTSSRQAALLLHAMRAQDKEWLLARLARDERATLETLLLELDVLGIPADAELLRPLLAFAVKAGEPAPTVQLAHLSPAQVATLSQALRTEPIALVTRLLAMRDWRWKTDLLARWSDEDRLRLTSAASGAPASRVLDAAICDAAVRLIACAPPQPFAARGRARWQSVWRALRGGVA